MVIAKTLPLGLVTPDYGCLREARVDDILVKLTSWYAEETDSRLLHG